MRIIAGRYKSVRLFSPKSQNVRPTSDRVRETIFSVLSNKVVDSNILDLFAGTGALGIEALSRGAQNATFVDFSQISQNIVRKNFEKLGIKHNFVKDRVENFIKRKINGVFDIIFFDPPYYYERKESLVSAVLSHRLLAESGLIVFEMGSKERLSFIPELEVINCKIIGDTQILFLERNE